MSCKEYVGDESYHFHKQMKYSLHSPEGGSRPQSLEGN